MQKRILIEIALDSGTYRYGEEDMRFPLSDPYPYDGRIKDAGSLKKKFADLLSGASASQQFSFSLLDVDNVIRDLRKAEEWRGRTVTVKIVDIDADSVLDSASFIIDKGKQYPAYVAVSCEERSMASATTDFPKNTITLTNFPDIPDGSDALGQTINICLGPFFKVPCYYISEDLDTDQYVYLLGYGPIDSVTAVYRDDQLVDSGDYTAYEDLYGSAVIIFDKKQLNHQGGLSTITASGLGLELDGSYTANAARVFQEFIENSTWGMGETADSTSFTAAIAACTTLGLKVGGVIQGKKNGEMWKREFIKACRDGRHRVGASGHELVIPEYSAVSEATFTDRNMVLIEEDETSAGSYVNDVWVDYYYDLETGKYLKNNEKTISNDFGKKQEFKLELVNDDLTASLFAQYKKKRIELQEDKIKFKALTGASELEEGSIITVTNTKLGLSAVQYVVEDIDKGKDTTIVAIPNLASVYVHDTETYQGDVPGVLDGTPEDVTGLAVTADSEVQNDGTVQSWFDGEYTAPTNNFLHAKISIKLSSGSTWQDIGTTDDGDFKIGNLTPGEEYDIKLISVNAAGLKSSGATLTDKLAAGDTSAPSTPTGFSASTTLMGQVALDWSDNSEKDLSHYNVYRAGSKIAETRSSKFFDNPPAYNTNYSYQVEAVDHTGNKSSKTAGQNGKKLYVNGSDIDITTGDITLAAGCDLSLTPHATSPSEIKFGTSLTISAASSSSVTFSALSTMLFYPKSDLSGVLQIGNSSNRWLTIDSVSSLSNYLGTNCPTYGNGNVTIQTAGTYGNVNLDSANNMTLQVPNSATYSLSAYVPTGTSVSNAYATGLKAKYRLWRDSSGYLRADT